jgi:hypothetical protein
VPSFALGDASRPLVGAKGRDKIRPGLHEADQLGRIGWRVLQGTIDHPHHVVVELLRGSKDFADGRKRLVGDGLILGFVGLDLGPDEIAHSGQHVAITDDVRPRGERSMSGHVLGLTVGDLEIVVRDRADKA